MQGVLLNPRAPPLPSARSPRGRMHPEPAEVGDPTRRDAVAERAATVAARRASRGSAHASTGAAAAAAGAPFPPTQPITHTRYTGRVLQPTHET